MCYALSMEELNLVCLKIPDKLIGDPFVTSIDKFVNGNISGLGKPINNIGQVVSTCSCDCSVLSNVLTLKLTTQSRDLTSRQRYHFRRSIS